MPFKSHEYPNSPSGGCSMRPPEKMGGFASYMEKMEGYKVRERSG